MAITPLPTPPSREDPNNFAERADALLAALVTFVTECNATAADINADEISAAASASTATTKAGDAAAARDIAMAAVNYKGLWSSLSGALNIPASVVHSNNIWMLTQSVANVAAETPGVSSKWLNVTPASGLGSAAYQPSSAFQPAIGAITALLKSTGSGNIAGASAADIVAAIGATAVQNATNATNATTAANATAIADGTVSTAAKIANSIITWSKMVAMSTGKLIGRSTAGGGSPEEINIGTGLALSGGSLSNSGVTSFNSRSGVVALGSGDVTSALGYVPAGQNNLNDYQQVWSGQVSTTTVGTGYTPNVRDNWGYGVYIVTHSSGGVCVVIPSMATVSVNPGIEGGANAGVFSGSSVYGTGSGVWTIYKMRKL